MEGVIPMLQGAESLLYVLIGGGLLTFIQFLINRHDSKNDRTKDILKAVADTNTRLTALEKSFAQDKATQARTKILRFRDELYNNIDHSQEYFEQVLDDIEAYNKYCSIHPEFRNGRTKIAAKYINDEYLRLFKAHKL